MIRLSSVLVLLSMAILFLVMLDTNGTTATLYTFVGHGLLGAVIVVYIVYELRERSRARSGPEPQPELELEQHE